MRIIDGGYTGMTQDDWDKLPGPNFTPDDDELIASLPPVEPFKPQD